MASADQIKALIASYLREDDDQFFSVAMQVAAHEAKLGHGQLAQELRDLIDAAKRRRPAPAAPGTAIHISKPRGELANLLTVAHPKNRLAEMVLAGSTAKQLSRIVQEQRHFDRIREHGLSPRRKLMLVGPPGTGKTMTAACLAGELGIPLFSVRLDALLTKFMGETASKLRQIFDSLSQIRGVYFFDEFDAIGSQRGITNDVGEIRRVLNSFLQMIEHDHSTSLIVAATNHPEILDYALYRRFDAVIKYEMPTQQQARELIRARLAPFHAERLATIKMAAAAEGMSFADITKAVEEALKAALMRGDAIKSSDIQATLAERRALSNTLSRRGERSNGRTRR
jgi:SpoVK/Ycf46/Vps4 family AAA+-type ATPase